METIFKILSSLLFLVYSVAFIYVGIRHRHTITVIEKQAAFILAVLFFIAGGMVWWN
jgi:hypothetical protein